MVTMETLQEVIKNKIEHMRLEPRSGYDGVRTWRRLMGSSSIRLFRSFASA